MGLALGSGAARGYAHLGVLQVLEEEKIPVDLIAGCSIGSVFGAFYARGLDLYMLEKMSKQLKRNQLLDFNVPRMGLLRGRKIEALVRLLTKNAHFSHLKKPFYVIAVDLKRGEEVVLCEGSVAEAVRASIAIPGVFVPKRYRGRLLVDGAVLNSMPAKVLRDQGADIVIGVDLRARGLGGKEIKINNIFDVLLRSIDLLGREANKGQSGEADVIIKPPVAHYNPANFEEASCLIPLGRKAAAQEIPRIRKMIFDMQKNPRRRMK